jgi:hypothetical protein
LVNGVPNYRPILWALLPCAVVLCAAAWLRGAEYDEQYTLFLTAGVPRPAWPAAVFPAGLARMLQSGDSSVLAIARDLRVTDVHPPLYFWLVLLWREAFGHGLFVARLLSVGLGLGALALTGVIARAARVPAVWAMALTLGCYGFAYTSVVARGFALAEVLLLGGVACLLLGWRWWHFALAGALFGAATLTNYLALFAAGACLLAMGLEAVWPGVSTLDRRRPDAPRSPRFGLANTALTRLPTLGDPWKRRSIAVTPWAPLNGVRRHASAVTFLAAFAGSDGERIQPPMRADERRRGNDRVGGRALRHALTALCGFLVFIPGDLWWFLAQRGSRQGQFPPFSLSGGLARLAIRFTGDILGGLPLYVHGVASLALTGGLGLLVAWCVFRLIWRWRWIGTPAARRMFALAALAPPVGLLLLGALFNNTPIEVRYLTFSTPFVGLLLAGVLGSRGRAVVLAVQAASILGLMLAPQTMQPARAAARAAAALVGDGVVLLPRGNDGVGVVGAFAIEAPPALPLLLIPAGATPEQIRARLGSWNRVVLVLIEQDDASRAASAAMRRALADPAWREVAGAARGEVAHRGNVAVYERVGGGVPDRI